MTFYTTQMAASVAGIEAETSCFQTLQPTLLYGICAKIYPDWNTLGYNYNPPNRISRMRETSIEKIRECLGTSKAMYSVANAVSATAYDGRRKTPSSAIEISGTDFSRWFRLGKEIFGWGHITEEAISKPEMLYHDCPLSFDLSDMITRAYVEFAWYRAPIENSPAVALFNKICSTFPESVRDNPKHPSFWLALSYAFIACRHPTSNRTPFAPIDDAPYIHAWSGRLDGGRATEYSNMQHNKGFANLLVIKAFSDVMINKRFTGRSILDMAENETQIGFSECVATDQLSNFYLKGGHALWIPIDDIPKMKVRSFFKKGMQLFIDLLPTKENPGAGVSPKSSGLQTVLSFKKETE